MSAIHFNYPNISGPLVYYGVTSFLVEGLMGACGYEVRDGYLALPLIKAIGLGIIVQLEVPGGISNLYRHTKAYTKIVAAEAGLHVFEKIRLVTLPLRLTSLEIRE